MGVIRKLLFRMKKSVAVAHLTLSTTSTSATWSPQTVTNSGATLTWDVSGDITPTSQNVNDPTFDLSANTGTVNMDVYDVGLVIKIVFQNTNLTLIDITKAVKLDWVDCSVNQLTSLDLSGNIELTHLVCSSNNLTSLSTTNNTLLENLYCLQNSITSLNLSANVSLKLLHCYINSIPLIDLSNNINLIDVQVPYNNMVSTATDQIYIDLANGIGVNGNLHIRNNRTTASDSARATLVTRGWTFDESYTT